MNALYAFAQTTKQAHFASTQRRLEAEDRLLMLEALLTTERGLHPAMSLKKIYHKLRPEFVGRDEFIDFGMKNGYESLHKVTFHKTTHSGAANAAPNLLHDKAITDIDQLWVSDLFYLKTGGQNLYVVLVEDVYSREILGYSASDRMFARANLAALQMALDTRRIAHFDQKLIHHSDKGTQYRSHEYTDQLKKHGIQISMGNCCFDNAFMESTNGIIKNEYLIHRPINSLHELVRHLKRDTELYNEHRPHGSLNMMTPRQFRRNLFNVPMAERTKTYIYTDKKRSNNLLLIKPDNQQLRFQFPGFT
jgi:transposase InsO family protein